MNQVFKRSAPRGALIFSVLLPTLFCATGCKKDLKSPAGELSSAQQAQMPAVEGNVVNNYQGLSSQTQWELQQARASTARYRQLKNAIKDGYRNINVIAENMGHHYMKQVLVDGNFDFRSPEILVYHKMGSEFELVAVEYAVPRTFPRPAGFTGSADVWDGNNDFGLWLLHAWVWMYNPLGVFHPTNPDVVLAPHHE